MIIIQTNPLPLHLKSAFFGFNKAEYRTSLVSKSLPIKKPIFATHSIWAIKTMHNVLPRGRSNEPWNRIVWLYICCNLKYLIWLSTLCRKLAWERATDKKIPSCLESLYSSCFQITLFSWCKGSIFSWLPVIFGHKISRSFQETYTADMTAIP